MVGELIQKYIWLIQTFIRAGERGLLLEEVQERWEDRFDGPYSRRTFNNHRSEVEEVFGIRIECSRSTNRYFIRNAEEVSDGHSESAWLIDTFTVNNMLSLSKERLHGRISVEEIPSGHRHLTDIMDAMSENNEIAITYRKYTSEETGEYSLRPYAVKEYARRWYMIAYCKERKGIRVYGLDRIRSLKKTGTRFRMPSDFDVDSLFATSFGIYLPEGRGRTITFRTSHTEAGFLRDLPIHHSQKEISSGKEHVTFSIFACPDRNMIMEFCRYGSRIEILSPQQVREAVAAELKKASEMYDEK